MADRHLIENNGPRPLDVVDVHGDVFHVMPGGYMFCEVKEIRHGDASANYSVRPEYSADGGRALPRSVWDGIKDLVVTR